MDKRFKGILIELGPFYLHSRSELLLDSKPILNLFAILRDIYRSIESVLYANNEDEDPNTTPHSSEMEESLFSMAENLDEIGISSMSYGDNLQNNKPRRKVSEFYLNPSAIISDLGLSPDDLDIKLKQKIKILN